MKKMVLILTMIIMVFTNSLSFAAEVSSDTGVFSTVESGDVKETTSREEEKELTGASDKILSNMSKKDRKIAEYKDKYNDTAYAYTAYYLDLIQLYSIPVCIIGLTIGAFNFFIVGEKKLDKKEQGFSFIRAFLCALVIFQVLPFLFALLVAGK